MRLRGHGGGEGCEAAGRSGRVVGARALGTAFVVCAALVGAAACGSGGDSASPSTAAASADRGREVYLAKCAECHGENLQGTNRGPSHLSSVYKPDHHSDDSFRRAVRQGSPQHHWRFGPMPPVPGVSDGDLDAVIAFVRAQQRQRGFTN